MWIPPRGCLKHKCLVSLFNKRALYPLQLDVHSFLGHILFRKTDGTRLLSDNQCIVYAIIVRTPSYGICAIHPRHSFWCPSSQLPAARVMRCTHIIEALLAHHGLSRLCLSCSNVVYAGKLTGSSAGWRVRWAIIRAVRRTLALGNGPK